MNAIQTFSRADVARAAVIFGKQSVIDYKLYDTQDVANGNTATTLQFFSNTRGGQGIYVTNMESANQLISGKQFLLTGIELDVNVVSQVSGTLQDLITVTHPKAAYTLKINQVEYAQGLVKDLLGGGLFGFGTPATYNQYATPRAPTRLMIDPALLIPTQTNFTFQFDYSAAPNPAATVTLRPKLVGKLIRLTSA